MQHIENTILSDTSDTKNTTPVSKDDSLPYLVACPKFELQEFPLTDCAFCSRGFASGGCPVADEHRQAIEAVPGRARGRDEVLIIIGPGDIVIRGNGRTGGKMLS